jgi:8-oxo-dGTP diphosphatase
MSYKATTEKYSEYEKCQIGIDPVILTIRQGKLHVYLQHREIEPHQNMYELPGILLLKNEEADDAIKRKLSEFFTQHIFFQQFYTFTNPNRDPRTRIISIGYIAIVPAQYLKETTQTKWTNIHNITNLAFDHNLIITKAMEYLKLHMNQLIASQFLPPKFALNDLQQIYEAIEETKYDNRNFRRKMLNANIVTETTEYETNVAHRPAKLYTFK